MNKYHTIKLSYILVLLWLMSACVPTQKYNLIVQSLQRNQTEKQQLSDSLLLVKKQMKVNDSIAKQQITIRTQQFDSLKNKLDELQSNYLSLQKNVFLQVQELQKDKSNYKSQLAQRDSLLHQIVQQSKQLIIENQLLTTELTKLKKGYASALPISQDDISNRNLLDSIQAKLLGEIGNFIGQEISINKHKEEIKLFLAHQLLFKNASSQLSEDGIFMLNLISKALKNEMNIQIILRNYAQQEVAEADRWEASMMQSSEVVKKLLANGIHEKQLQVIHDSGLQAEVGTVFNRVELLIQLKK
ncbi:MAG: hypothetical protein MUE81_12100 [Thermoflexibacter sp.]|jgi:flagellar motor protein MotB|nr:hypothetical protein [Thermoflexibacter sp.]